MEGRTIVRPDHIRSVLHREPVVPSMEGRTIVRPDPRGHRVHTRPRRILQWRAGQSSGQTPYRYLVSYVLHEPSMEGRTIVRPDRVGMHPSPQRFDFLQWRAGQSSGQTCRFRRRCRRCRWSFNGGPDNRPARRHVAQGAVTHHDTLQWRAGQSSGQTPPLGA